MFFNDLNYLSVTMWSFCFFVNTRNLRCPILLNGMVRSVVEVLSMWVGFLNMVPSKISLTMSVSGNGRLPFDSYSRSKCQKSQKSIIFLLMGTKHQHWLQLSFCHISGAHSNGAVIKLIHFIIIKIVERFCFVLFLFLDFLYNFFQIMP